MRLFNDSDELVIADRDGVQVDRVRWDDGRTFPDPNGASMSLADPNADNALGENWCTATTAWAVGDQGTPRPAHVVLAARRAADRDHRDHVRPRDSRRASATREWFEVANLGEQTRRPERLDDHRRRLPHPHDLEPRRGARVSRPCWPPTAIPRPTAASRPTTCTAAGVPLYNQAGRVVLESTDRRRRRSCRLERGARLPDPDRAARSRSPSLPPTTRSAPTGARRSIAAATATSAARAPPTRASNRPPPAELEISEIMRNPAVVGDSVGEWIEIHNPTAADVDLDGWAIDDGASDLHTVRGSLVVAAGGYVVRRPLDRRHPQRWRGGRLLVPRVVRARQRRRLDRPPRRARPSRSTR